MKTMTYKGYTASIDYSDEDQCLIGRVLDIQDGISFDGESISEIRAAFHEAIDDYLETSEKIGRPAQKPCSGKLMLRVPPEVHRHALTRAQAAGKSLNQWAAGVLEKAAHGVKL